MPLFLHLCIVWLQNKLAWSNSRQAWVERLTGLTAVGAGAAVWWLGGSLSLPHQAVLWALLLVGAAILLRRGWLKLFGPVLFYDLVLTARRRRHAVLRCLYAALLIYGMVVLYLIRLAQGDLPVNVLAGNLFALQKLPTHTLTELTNVFFFLFFFVQMALTLILTPAYTAGAIAAEKERQTLDALLATDLRNREIVLSILVSRLANLVLILLTGLPILSLMEFLGGLDPNLVLAMYAATGLTLASLGCFGILNSVRFAKPRTAIMRTYLWVLFYLGASSLSWLLLLPGLDLAHFPSTTTWTSPVEVEDVVQWFNAGNPGSAMVQLIKDLRSGIPLDKLLPDVLRAYAWFHGGIAVACLVLAVVRFRAWTLPAGAEGVTAKTGFFRKQSLPPLWGGLLRRRIGRWPMLWKELFVETGVRRGWLGWLGIGILVAISFVPALHLVAWFGGVSAMLSWGEGIQVLLNLWIRVLSAVIGSLLLIQVGIRAAGSISGERARQTLDSLLITPLEARAILRGKWLGAVLNPRWAWVWLGLIWTWGFVVGAVSPGAVPGFVLAWLVYAGFMASLGLYLSVATGTTQRATIWTLLIGFLAMAITALLAFDFLPQLGGYGVVPPIGLGMLPFLHSDASELSNTGFGSLKSVFLGLALWVALALFLGFLASLRFHALIGRKKRPARKKTMNTEAQAVVAGAAPVSAAVPVVTENVSAAPAPAALVPEAMAVGGPSIPVAPIRVATASRSKTSWFRKSRDEDGPRMPPERWRRLKTLRPAIPLLVPFAVLLGVYVVEALRDQRQLEQALAETDRLDPGWRWEDLKARRPRIADADNSRFPVEAAFRLIPKARDSWFLKQMDEAFQDDISPEVQINALQRRALTAELTAAAAALKEAHRLVEFPQGHFPLVWEGDILNLRLPHVEWTRTIAHLLHYDVIGRADQHDPDGALRSCRAILNAERAIGDEPLLISQLTRNTIRTFAIRGIERTLAQGEPSEAALLDLQRLLEREESDPSRLLIALRGERAALDDMMQHYQNGKVPIQRFFAYFGSGGNPLRDLEVFFTGSMTRQRAALLGTSTQMVEAAKLPPEQRAARFKAWASTLGSQPWLVQASIPAIFRLEPNFRRNEAELRCTLVMVAVERFRRKYQRWPASLNELAPAFLSRLPTDPCNGLPLCYRRLKDGVVIYSVGEDGVDNGGNVQRRGGVIAGFDWGVRLWDVPYRRQPAGPRGLPNRPGQ